MVIMLPRDETILANMMLLQDRMKKRKEAMSKIESMATDYDQLIKFIDDRWDDLYEDEKNQVLDRYKQEREKGKVKYSCYSRSLSLQTS